MQFIDWLIDFIHSVIDHLALTIYFAIITSGFIIMLSIEQPYIQAQFQISLAPVFSVLGAAVNIVLLYGFISFILRPFNIDLDLSDV